MLKSKIFVNRFVKLNIVRELRNPFTTSTCNMRRGQGNKTLSTSVDAMFSPGASTPQSPDKLKILRPTLFTIFVPTVAFTGAAIWEYENLKKRARDIFSSSNRWMGGKLDPSKLRVQYNIRSINNKEGSIRRICNNWWNSLREGDKIFYPILAVNVLVWALWRVPALKPNFMMKYFMAGGHPSTICLPMIFSTFSHHSFIHLAFNMIALHSFMFAVSDSLGKEQLLATYISAGTIASYASYMFRGLTRNYTSSLGASGAVLGLVAYACSKDPNSQLMLIFLPFFYFSAGTALKALIALDVCGLVAGWKIFDHAAHLGGTMFGLFWYYYGQKHIWRNREPLLEKWHSIRSR